MSVPEDLLQIMVCPDCHSPLREEDGAVVCTGCGLHYPVHDGGIPVMLPEAAYRPGEEEKQ